MVTLKRSSIIHSIQSISELEPFLGLCRTYNSVVDLQQEALYFFAAYFKLGLILEWPGRKKTGHVGESLAKLWLITSVGETDSGSGVTYTGGKTSNNGKPLAIFCLLTSVVETDSDSGVTWTKTNKRCVFVIYR